MAIAQFILSLDGNTPSDAIIEALSGMDYQITHEAVVGSQIVDIEIKDESPQSALLKIRLHIEEEFSADSDFWDEMHNSLEYNFGAKCVFGGQLEGIYAESAGEIDGCTFRLLPNGAVLRVDHQGVVTCTVSVPGIHQPSDDREAAIKKAVTGDVDGLILNSVDYVGGDFVRVKGLLSDTFSDLLPVSIYSDEFKLALMNQYSLSEIEASHAIGACDIDCQDLTECVIDIAGGPRQLRSPSYPANCHYVRITVDGFEIAYWNEDEFKEDPSQVVGALMGAAKGRPVI